jgi:hypothetical protein
MKLYFDYKIIKLVFILIFSQNRYIKSQEIICTNGFYACSSSVLCKWTKNGIDFPQNRSMAQISCPAGFTWTMCDYSCAITISPYVTTPTNCLV